MRFSEAVEKAGRLAAAEFVAQSPSPMLLALDSPAALGEEERLKTTPEPMPVDIFKRRPVPGGAGDATVHGGRKWLELLVGERLGGAPGRAVDPEVLELRKSPRNAFSRI